MYGPEIHFVIDLLLVVALGVPLLLGVVWFFGLLPLPQGQELPHRPG
jgi:hypothetical protein